MLKGHENLSHTAQALFDCERAAHAAMKAHLAAIHSAILDGPDPTEKACLRCGLVTCPFPAADVEFRALPQDWGAGTIDEDRDPLTWDHALLESCRAVWRRWEAAKKDCESRPAVDWRAQLAKLREVAR